MFSQGNVYRHGVRWRIPHGTALWLGWAMARLLGLLSDAPEECTMPQCCGGKVWAVPDRWRSTSAREATTGQAAFAALHTGRGPFLLPNAWDVASGVLLAEAGFSAIGTTSLGVTAGAGLPDGAGAGRDLTVALAAALVPRLAVPLTVDLEGGYAEDPLEVAQLAAGLAELGVAGINLEDGRPDGQLRPVAEHAAVIQAVAVAAPALFVNARTDTYWLRIGTEQERLPETIRRLAAYRDAGASGVFTPGLSDPAAIERVASAVALPLNVLWQPGVTLAELDAAGVARVSTGSALYRHALGAALAATTAAGAAGTPSTEPVDYAELQHHLAGVPPPPNDR